jgi:hypothetical protein
MGIRKRVNKTMLRKIRKRKMDNRTRKIHGGGLRNWLLIAGALVALYFGEFKPGPSESTNVTTVTTSGSFTEHAGATPYTNFTSLAGVTSPPDISPTDLTVVSKPDKIVTMIVSDTHGADIIPALKASGIMKVENGKCAWDPTTTIHRWRLTGDIVDRGPFVEENLFCLIDFIISANLLNGDGTAVAMLGNHELLLMEWEFGYAHKKDRVNKNERAHRITDKIRKSVLDGTLKAAHMEDGVLYTHAGVTGKFMKTITSDKGFKAFSKKKITDQNVADILVPYLNAKLKDDVARGKPNGPITFEGSMYGTGARGNSGKPGGIFWADESEHLVDKVPAIPGVLQVTGHNTQDREINYLARNKLVLGDSGHHRRGESALMYLTHERNADGTYLPTSLNFTVMTENDGLVQLNTIIF